MVIAIDGPAGAGKSTVARAVACALGYRYLDTGAMYRAVALAALRGGVGSGDARGLAALADLAVTMTSDPELRTPEVESSVSLVAAHPEVREALHRAQRAFLAQGDAVGEGRDVGAVVWPEAELKVWLDADPGVRAARRVLEQGNAAAAAALAERDRRDAAQTVKAPDAVAIDSTDLELPVVIARILGLAREHGA
ncbi:MAG: CMP/dCMP kinase [Gaiellales bacterium]|nr:CMP/dCMP kinase [Gaiellales bacterium]